MLIFILVHDILFALVLRISLLKIFIIRLFGIMHEENWTINTISKHIENSHKIILIFA